jgi:hypothetical protein
MGDLSEFLQKLDVILNVVKLNEESIQRIVKMIKDELPEDIKLVYEFANTLRIILSINARRANYQIPLVCQANGIIIEIYEADGILKHKLLVEPTRNFNVNVPHAQIARLMAENEYDIYEIEDGTILNMYWHNKQWLLSTKNAFDVSNLKWRGYTYREILLDILKNYPDFSFEKLDKSQVYTIGIKHPAFHPFAQPTEWNDSASEWIKKIWICGESELMGIPIQAKITAALVFTEMLEKSKLAFNKYCDDGDVFLGYILRSRSKKYADVLIESTLWNTIRKFIYQLPFTKDNNMENNFKNMNYCILLNYFNIKRRHIFELIFPQFSCYFRRYNRIYDELANKIYLILTGDGNRTNDKIMTQLLVRFVPIIKNLYQPTNANDKKIIKNLLMDIKYIDIFYNILHVQA